MSCLHSLPVYLSNILKRVQNRAMSIILPLCSYDGALIESGLTKLSHRRQELVNKLFKEGFQNEQKKLHELLPARNTCTFNQRNICGGLRFKTNRFRNSFITFNSLKASTILVKFLLFIYNDLICCFKLFVVLFNIIRNILFL